MMHPTALEGFGRMLDGIGNMPGRPRILDVGGADVNGTVHATLSGWRPAMQALDVLDIEPGPGVTLVGDATDPRTLDRIGPEIPLYDLVISTETLEHVQDWQAIVRNARSALHFGGWFIGTCAGYGRRAHGARGAHDPAPGEWYHNVNAAALVQALYECFGGEVVVEYSRRPEFPTTNDLYWRAQA